MNDIRFIDHNGSVYAAAIEGDGMTHLCYSTNKITWLQSDTSMYAAPQNLISFGGKFYAFLYNHPSYVCIVSENGTSWTSFGMYMNGVVVGSKFFVYDTAGVMSEVIDGTPTAVSTYPGIGLEGPETVISAKSLCDYPIFIVNSYDDDNNGQLLVWYNGSSWSTFELDPPDDGGYWYSGIASDDTIILTSFLL